MTLFLTANKDLFACGWNGAKQFAWIESSNLFYPTQLDFERLFGTKNISLNQINWSDKTIVFQLGSNKLYQCGSIIGKPKNFTSQSPILIKEIDFNILDTVWARSQMFVIGNEIVKTDKVKKNEQIMNILNTNQIFYSQNNSKSEPLEILENTLKKKDLKKIIQEKKRMLVEEREKRMQIRAEIFQPVYCKKIQSKRNCLKSEEVARTVHNKEPLKEFVDQKISTLVEEKQEEDVTSYNAEPKQVVSLNCINYNRSHQIKCWLLFLNPKLPLLFSISHKSS